MGSFGLAILIEGLGDRHLSATDSEYRYAFCTTAASDMVSGLYFENTLVVYPSEISVTTDFVAGTSTIGGQSFQLDGMLEDVTSRLYRTRTEKISNLAGSTAAGIDVDATETEITLHNDDGSADTTQADKNIIIGREAFQTLDHQGSGLYEVRRAQFSTLGTAHNVDVTSDTEVYLVDDGPILVDRAVELVRYDLDDWAGRITLWRGVINEITAPSLTRIQITADSALSLLKKRNICTKLFKGDVKLQFGTGSISINVDQDTTPMVAQNATPGTGDNFLMSVNGESAIVASWFTLVDNKYTITGHAENILTDSAPMQTDVRGEFWEFLSTSPEAPDLDQAGNRFGHMAGVTNPSAITACLQILCTTVHGNNGDYDLGGDRPILGQTMGVGILEDLIDITGIEAVREQIGTDDEQRSLMLAFDGEPVNVYDWISNVLKGFGAVLTTGDEGKITIVRLLDWPAADAPSVTEDDFVGEVRQSRGLRDAVDSLTIEYHNRPGLGPITVTFRDALHYERMIASSRNERMLPLHGVVDVKDADRIASAYLERFRHPIPAIQCKLLRDKDYWPGQILKLTHPMLYDTDGTRGITDGVFLVTGRRFAIRDSAIFYEMKRMDLGRIGLIGPSGLVSSYSNGGGGGPYVVTWADTSPVDVGQGSFGVGDDVQLRNSDMSVSDVGPYTVTAVTASTMTLSSDIGASSGEWVWLAKYDLSVTHDEWAWIADSSGQLGAANDDAFILVTI